MKRIIIISAALAMGLIGLVVWQFSQTPKGLKVSLPFAANIQFPSAVSQTKFRFFTGYNFVEYDLATHKTTPLSAIYSLPTVTTMKWSKSGVLFSASGYNTDDDLGRIIDQRQLPLENSYWWHFDLTSKKFSLLGNPEYGEGVADAIWLADDSGYMFLDRIENADHELETTLVTVARDGKQTSASGQSMERLVWADKSNMIVIIKNETTALVNVTAGSRKILIENINTDYVNPTPDGKEIYFVKVKEGTATDDHADDVKGDLYSYDIANNKQKLVLKGWVASAHSANGTTFFVSYDDSSVKLARRDGDKAKQYSLATEDIAINHIVPLSSDSLLITGPNNRLVIASTDGSEFANLPTVNNDNEVTAKKTVYKEGFYIAYFPDTTTYSVYASPPFEQNWQKAFDYLETLGVDPHLLNMEWYRDEPAGAAG